MSTFTVMQQAVNSMKYPNGVAIVGKTVDGVGLQSPWTGVKSFLGGAQRQREPDYTDYGLAI